MSGDIATMQTVRVGVIGAGGIAKQHLDVIREMPGIEAVAIASRTRSKAEALASAYDIPCVSNDLPSMVRQGKLDALMVLVSVEQMYTVTLAAAAYRLPLFVEKPAGALPLQNQELAVLATERGIPTMVGFNRRYYSIFQKGIDIIREHGPILGVAVEGHERMWRVREGGKFSSFELDHWLFGNSVHTIDLLRFFGGDVSRIHTIVHRRFGEAHGDQFSAVMELASGAIGQYSAHWYSPGGWRVALYGDGVTVEFTPLEKGVWVDKNFQTHAIMPDEVDVNYKPGFYRQMDAFRILVRDGVSPWPAQDLGGSYKTMQLAEAMAGPFV